MRCVARTQTRGAARAATSRRGAWRHLRLRRGAARSPRAPRLRGVTACGHQTDASAGVRSAEQQFNLPVSQFDQFQFRQTIALYFQARRVTRSWSVALHRVKSATRALTPAPPQIDISLVVIITVFPVGVCACSRGRSARQRTCMHPDALPLLAVTHCRYTVFFPTIVLAQNFLVIIQRACCSPAAC
jgi:hypothetical protein